MHLMILKFPHYTVVSCLVWVSWSRLLIITNSFAEKTTRIFTGFWTLATSSRWSQSPPLYFLVTVVWFFSIRLTSTTLNRWRTESSFYNKSNKLLFLSTQLWHKHQTTVQIQYIFTCTCFCWYIEQLSALTWVSYFVSKLGPNCFIRRQRNINSWECFCVFADPLSAQWSNCMKCTHPFMSKLFAPKFLMRFTFLQATQVDHGSRAPSGTPSLPHGRLVASLFKSMYCT